MGGVRGRFDAGPTFHPGYVPPDSVRVDLSRPAPSDRVQDQSGETGDR